MKIFSQYSLICLLTVCLFSCSTKQKSDYEQAKQYKKFITEMNSRGFSTGNILIYENGKIIFESSDGLRTINPNDSLTLDSQFRIASISKQFTGVAIMKLKQAGKLDYDQKVNTILIDFPYENITIRHLLHHTSGLADYEEIIEENFIPQDSLKRYILGNEDILKIFFDSNPDLNFHPGEDWEYSNTGYMIFLQKFSKMLTSDLFNN